MNAAQRFGQSLRDARQLRGLTVEQLASESRVPVGHIEALESGRLNAIPGGMYRRAEARAYAEALGLDPAVVLEDLRRAVEAVPLSSDGSHLHAPAAAAPAEAAAARGAMGGSALRGAVLPRLARAVVVLALGTAALLWERTPDVTTLSVLPDAPAMGLEAAAVIDEAIRTVEPPAPAPALTRALYDPRIVVNGQGWPRDGRLDEGVLVVHSTPRGARVTVNGVGWGETPVAIRYLPLGTLRVRIGKEEHVVQERTIALTANRPSATLRVSLPPLARRRAPVPAPAPNEALVITTRPAGARVTVNGIGWGTTPVTIPHLSAGTQRVRVVKDQFRSEERVVTVREGRSSHVSIDLKPTS